MIHPATAGRQACCANSCAAATSTRPLCLSLPSTTRTQCSHRARQRSRQAQQKQQQSLLGRSLRKQQAALRAHGAIVPNVPLPGDDQGSTIYSALSDIEETASSVLDKAQGALDDATPSTSGSAPDKLDASMNGSGSPGPNGKGPVPHRWVIVGAMALAFVLCNMDKVKACSFCFTFTYFIYKFLSEMLPSASCFTAGAGAGKSCPVCGETIESCVHDMCVFAAQVNMSVAVIPMAADLNWSASDRGLVSSAFFWGYSLTQVPAGWLSTRCAPSMPVCPRRHIFASS